MSGINDIDNTKIDYGIYNKINNYAMKRNIKYGIHEIVEQFIKNDLYRSAIQGSDEACKIIIKKYKIITKEEKYNIEQNKLFDNKLNRFN